jgi:hypothetical protein
VAEFLKNPPSVLPQPDFAKVCALQKHIIKALKQLKCSQSHIHGWSGLIMDPALYQLLKPIAFVKPVSLGDTPVYPMFAPPVAIKSIDNVFKRSRKYYLLYMNINHGAFECSTRPFPTVTRSQTTRISWDGTHHVHPFHHQPAQAKLWHAQPDGPIQQQHVILKSILSNGGTRDAFLLHQAVP